MKKRPVFYSCIIFLLFLWAGNLKCRASVINEEPGSEPAEESELEKIPYEMTELFNQNYMQEIIGYLDRSYGRKDLDVETLWNDILQGNTKEGLKEFGITCKNKIFFEFYAGKEIFMTILLLAILSSLFTMVMDIVENKQVSQLGFYFIYLLLCIMLGEVFRMIYQETGELLLSVTDFVKVLIPAYAAALGMTSGASTAIVYYEGILFIIWCVEEILYRMILPWIEFYVLLSLMNGVWSAEKLNSLLQGMKKGIEFILKVIIWGVGGIGVLEAMITPVVESLKWNMAKKLTSIVPGLGNISEGVSEIFIGSAVLIRNGIGVFFTVILLFLCLAPLCKIFVVAVCLKMSSALGAVVNHSSLTSCSDKVAEASFLLCRVLLTGIGLFLMSIAITMLAVNRNF